MLNHWKNIANTSRKVVNVSPLKKGIWLYFYLIIFEGALRKWVLPGLSDPLLLVRDPLALWIIYKALQLNVWKPNFSTILMVGVTVFAFLMALLVGHGNLLVAIFGMRITVVHFPLIFIIGKLFNNEDVIKMGKMLLWISIFMTLLVAIQFYSPQTAWVNRGLGGDTKGSGFSGVGEFFRVPGTFSFTSGLANFYGLVAAVVFYFWMDLKKIGSSKTMLICATITLFIAMPLTVSRTFVAMTGISFVFMLIISAKNPKVIRFAVMGLVVAVAMVSVLSMFDFFQTATSVFTERYTNATTSEGGTSGTLNRFLGGFTEALESDNIFFGMGLGMGTNAGAKLATGKVTYLIAEGEWGRLVGEMGLLLGLIMIIIRASLVYELMLRSWKAVKNNAMPWMLMSFGFLNILQGQWAQPTALGFSTLTAGLVLAALNKPINAKKVN